MYFLNLSLGTRLFLMYQICDLFNTKITKFVTNGEQMDKIQWNLTVWRNLIKSLTQNWKKKSKLEYIGMKNSISDFEHISLLSFILRILTFALYSYGVLVSEKSLRSNFWLNGSELWSKLDVKKSKQLNALKRDHSFFLAHSKLSAI